MPRFFCEDIINNDIILSREDIHHITKVLRMKINDNLTVCDKNGMDYECEINNITEGEVNLKINAFHKTLTEPSVKITLYQALPKGDKLDFIVQKAVELGVHEIVPVSTTRCIAKWESKTENKKITRLQKIAYEAAKQSGRGIIPQILPQMSFSDAIKKMQSYKNSIICYEKYGNRLNEIIDCDCDEIAILIGSEGGFEENEILRAKDNGIKIASLGKLILRCETAPISAISIIMNITKNI